MKVEKEHERSKMKRERLDEMHPVYKWTSVIIWLYSWLSACAFYKSGGWRDEGNKIEIKADMTLLNLFQLDELKGSGAASLDLPSASFIHYS